MAKFDWDEFNTAQIANRGVEPHEAEEIVANDPIDLSIVLRNGEERSEQIGETSNGRILRADTTFRNGMIRVVTAIPLRTRWHNRYFELKEKWNGNNQSSS